MQEIRKSIIGPWILASVLVHGAGSMVAAWAVRGGSEPGAPLTPDIMENARTRIVPPPMTLGIAKSRAVTVNWLGFESPTEHMAPVSEVEQPQLVLEAAGGGEPMPESEATPEEPAIAPSIIAAASEEILRARQRVVDRLETLRQRMEAAARAAASSARASRPGPEKDPAEREGIKAESESDAAALAETLEIKPGQVVAAEGIVVRTVRPEWRLTTLLTSSPKNPLVRLHFGADGKVAEAAFAESSGDPMVDAPLLNAVYRWTAKGEAIDAIEGPEGRFTVTIRVLLVR